MCLKIITEISLLEKEIRFKRNIEYIHQNLTKVYNAKLKCYKDYIQFNQLIS